MLATNPLQIDGQTFDRFSLNLAISGKYKADDGSTDAHVAMRLIPTRIEDGQVITADAHAIGISLGTLAGADAPTQTAVAAIQSALQTYLQTKGL
jgi:hypothetical protein